MLIIEHLAGAREGATLAELAATLASPKSSLLLLLKSLAALQFVTRQGNRYSLGPAMYGLAAAVMKRGSLPEVARQIMRGLWKTTGETIILAVLKMDEPAALYVDQIESTNAVRYTVQLGSVRPLYCSAAGRVLLAFQSDAWRDGYLRTTEFKRLTDRTIVDPKEIRRRVDKARRERFALSIEEVSDGGAGFAAPVFDHSGGVVAALVLGTVAGRVRQKGAWYRSQVTKAAREMSRALGYQDPSLPSKTDGTD